MNGNEYPETIVQALQTVARLSCIESVGEVSRHMTGTWRVPLSIRRAPTEADCPHVPPVTTWCVVVESFYPGGGVDVYPAGESAVEATFPHQLYNSASPSSAHRTGKICLDTARLRVSRAEAGADPVGDADSRLAWYVTRARAWLDAACRNALMDPEEPFELPHLPAFSSAVEGTFAHDEGADTFEHWQGVVGTTGRVELRMLADGGTTRLAANFLRPTGETLRRARSSHTEAIPRDADPDAFWWLWPHPIVLSPWRAPRTWGELREVGHAQGIEVDRALKDLVSKSRPGKSTIFFLGYPIPERWHGAPLEIHWQAVHLPTFSAGLPPQPGFRDNPTGRWQRLRTKVLRDDTGLGYVRTANWHPGRLQARGRVSASLRNGKVCIVGVGALGAAVAELLARGGCERLVLIDGERLEVGNLVRHPLTVAELDQNKAEALARRLRAAAPMASVEAVADDIPLDDEDAFRKLLDDAAFVCDCTGENAVIDALGRPWWALPKVFLSASLGQAARRLFLFSAAGQRFDADAFWEAISSWDNDETFLPDDVEERFEGAGCWSPLFPARGDDVWLAASAAVRKLEQLSTAPSTVTSHLLVLEQIEPPGCGFVPVTSESVTA